MKIEIGKSLPYENRTLKYLYPSFILFGSTFISKFNLVHKLAYGIDDKLLEGSHFDRVRKVCILIDRKVRPHDYDNFIRWVKHQEYYLADYSSDDTITGRQQMLVLAFPIENSSIYDTFKLGKYSKMYPFEEIEKYFFYDNFNAKGVLIKSVAAKKDFVKLINEKYRTNLKVSDIERDAEYDLMWEKQQEIFNN
jgi:hypothetical protein